MTNGTEKDKGTNRYIASHFENPKIWGPKMAEGLIQLEKIISEIVNEQKKVSKKIDEIKEHPFYADKPLGELTNQVIEATKSVILDAGTRELKKYMESEEGRQKIREEIEKNYRDILKSQVKEVIEDKTTGILPILKRNFKKVATIATTGIGLVVILTVGGGVLYLANKTTTGNITKIENRIGGLEKGRKASTKKYEDYDEELKSLKKSLEDIATYQKNSDEQLKARFNLYEKEISELKDGFNSYEKQINDFKSGLESYQKDFEEIKSSNEAYTKKLNDLEKKLSDVEKRINEVDKKYETRIKSYKKTDPK